MVSFIARGLLIAAFAALVAAGTAPASVPDDTIYLYSDTNCENFLSSYTVDQIKNTCTEAVDVLAYAIGDIDACNANIGAFNVFGLYEAVGAGKSCEQNTEDESYILGGGCNKKSCQVTHSSGGKNLQASFVIAGSTSNDDTGY